MTDASSRLQFVRDGIAAAARVSRRDANDVTLVAVSKTRSADQIAELIVAGQRDFGESRVQEVESKWPALRTEYPGVRLHCIGRLQSNKADEAVALFDVIHSLDRPSLRGTLDDHQVLRHGRECSTGS